jgi:hypothetical protein
MWEVTFRRRLVAFISSTMLSGPWPALFRVRDANQELTAVEKKPLQFIFDLLRAVGQFGLYTGSYRCSVNQANVAFRPFRAITRNASGIGLLKSCG